MPKINPNGKQPVFVKQQVCDFAPREFLEVRQDHFTRDSLYLVKAGSVVAYMHESDQGWCCVMVDIRNAPHLVELPIANLRRTSREAAKPRSGQGTNAAASPAFIATMLIILAAVTALTLLSLRAFASSRAANSNPPLKGSLLA
jgi:hypothetical protein